MLETTLRKLREHKASNVSYGQLVEALGDEYGDDTPLPVSRILDINGVSDALWALRACDMSQKDKNAVYLLACDYAEHVLPVFENKHPDDPYPRAAIEARRAWVRGEISDEELKRAADAATASASAAYSADSTNPADAYAAYAAADSAACAYSAAAYFAVDAVDATGDATASDAVYFVAYLAAYFAIHCSADVHKEKEWQAQKLKEIL